MPLTGEKLPAGRAVKIHPHANGRQSPLILSKLQEVFTLKILPFTDRCTGQTGSAARRCFRNTLYIALFQKTLRKRQRSQPAAPFCHAPAGKRYRCTVHTGPAGALQHQNHHAVFARGNRKAGGN